MSTLNLEQYNSKGYTALFGTYRDVTLSITSSCFPLPAEEKVETAKQKAFRRIASIWLALWQSIPFSMQVAKVLFISPIFVLQALIKSDKLQNYLDLEISAIKIQFFFLRKLSENIISKNNILTKNNLGINSLVMPLNALINAFGTIFAPAIAQKSTKVKNIFIAIILLSQLEAAIKQPVRKAEENEIASSEPSLDPSKEEKMSERDVDNFLQDMKQQIKKKFPNCINLFDDHQEILRSTLMKSSEQEIEDFINILEQNSDAIDANQLQKDIDNENFSKILTDYSKIQELLKHPFGQKLSCHIFSLIFSN